MYIFAPFISLPPLCVLSLSSGVPPPNPARGFGERYDGSSVSTRTRSPAECLTMQCIHDSGLKITLPVVAILRKNSHNQLCAVTCVGHATYHDGISEKSGGMVSNRPIKCRYGIYRPTSSPVLNSTVAPAHRFTITYRNPFEDA